MEKKRKNKWHQKRVKDGAYGFASKLTSTKYCQLRYRARMRGFKMTLTPREFERLLTQDCYFCGGKLPVTGHGMDRLDNRKGYASGNVVPCCRRCNEVKGHLEAAGFQFPRTIQLMFELGVVKDRLIPLRVMLATLNLI